MDNTVDIRGVADMALIEFQFEDLVDALQVQGQCGTIREMVDQGFNPAQINGANKKLHAGSLTDG